MRAFYMPLGVPSFGAQAYVPKTDPGCHCAWSKRYWLRQRAAEEMLKDVAEGGYGNDMDAALAAVARLRLSGATQ